MIKFSIELNQNQLNIFKCAWHRCVSPMTDYVIGHVAPPSVPGGQGQRVLELPELRQAPFSLPPTTHQTNSPPFDIYAESSPLPPTSNPRHTEFAHEVTRYTTHKSHQNGVHHHRTAERRYGRAEAWMMLLRDHTSQNGTLELTVAGEQMAFTSTWRD